MASKVLVPTGPFTKLQVKKTSPDTSGGGFIIGGDAAARVAHLEHSVRFLQEQHRLMLSGLHAEIEALRERNRDLQFQLIFNKETSPKVSPASEDTADNNEENLRKEINRLEKEASTAKCEARAAEARALQLQKVIDAQAEKLRSLELQSCGAERCAGEGAGRGGEGEGRAELRARLAEAERLVRRLRADADRQRREVLGGAGAGVTNLLFDGAAATHAHLQCMKNSLHASLRASGLDSYGYQNNYHFPPVHTPDFWREPLREEYSVGPRGRRPLTLPELARSTVYANNHVRGRGYGYEKNKKASTPNGDTVNGKSTEEQSEERLRSLRTDSVTNSTVKSHSETLTLPELKIVVTKMIPRGNVRSPGGAGGAGGQGGQGEARRARRQHHRKHTTDHT